MPNLKTIAKIIPEAARNLNSTMACDKDLRAQLEIVADLIDRAPKPLPNPALVFAVHGDGVRAVAVNERLRIGRSDECELSFPGKREVSRLHCVIELGTHGYVIRDTDSSYGTQLRRLSSFIKEEELRDGDLVIVGGMVFAFLWDSESE